MSGPLPPYASDGQNALFAAVSWIQECLTGSLATSIALIAIAAVGLSMFLGQFPVRRGICVILGCFILFGAPAIAGGLMAFVQEDGSAGAGPSDLSANVVRPPNPKPVPWDPYAGASLPDNQ